jgi:hypothetical protein
MAIVTEISTLKLVLTPARYENHQFVTYSNENLDDIANASSDYEIEMKVGKKFAVTTDLDTDTAVEKTGIRSINLQEKQIRF